MSSCTPDIAHIIHFMKLVQAWAKFSTDLNDVIKEVFNLFDKDGSGSISVDEFREVMVIEGAQMTDEEIDDILNPISDGPFVPPILDGGGAKISPYRSKHKNKIWEKSWVEILA